jgi:hypothetical protein
VPSFPNAARASRACPVCEDERQYVNWKGQQWLTREALASVHSRSGATTSAFRNGIEPALRSGNARCGAGSRRLRDVGLHSARDREAVAIVARSAA